MGLLDSFEKGLERAVNSAFAKTFRSGCSPSRSPPPCAASSTRRPPSSAATAFSCRTRSRCACRPPTTSACAPSAARSATSSTPSCRSTRRRRATRFAGPVSITLERDEQLVDRHAPGRSATAAGPVAWRGVLDVEASGIRSSKSRTVIGRGSDADITIADAGTSRKHVEILWDGERAMVRDLGSTNGTLLNGRKVDGGRARAGLDRHDRPHRHRLPGPRAGRAARSRPLPAADATRAFDVREGGPLP